MPKALLTTEAILHQPGRHTEILESAGFEVTYPQNSEFGRGLCGLEESVKELTGVDALLAGSEFVTSEMLSRLPQLRVIARLGVGYDRIDVDAASQHDVVLTITPTANRWAVAEHALSLLFAVSKNVVNGDRATRSGDWPRKLTEPIRGKTIGILGFGRTGQAMAIHSQALGMHVIAYDPYPNEAIAAEHNIELVDLPTLATRSDVISIHCPAIPETQGLVDASFLAKMKSTAIVINTARGPIIKESDLITALESGQIAAAGLDVYEQEPPLKSNRLFELDNVVLTPHSAGGESLAMRDMAIEAAQCVVDLHGGRWPSEAIVNKTLAPDWRW